MPFYFHDRVFGVELAICVFVRFLNTGDGLDHIERAKKIDVHFRRVADKSDYGDVVALADVRGKPEGFYPFEQVVHWVLVVTVFNSDYHIVILIYSWHEKTTAFGAVVSFAI